MEAVKAQAVIARQGMVFTRLEVDGPIVALWPEASGNNAIEIVKKEDTGWYEAYRISLSCGM